MDSQTSSPYGPGALIKWSSKLAPDKNSQSRVNQRRHRERARARLADLESRLAATQSQLEQAQGQIRILTAELQRHQDERKPEDQHGISPADLAGVVQQPSSAAIAAACSAADLYPLTRMDESTVLCLDAYRIVLEHNHSRLDEAVVLALLQPGFRRSARAGEGCRVTNAAVFACLDRSSLI